jgi:methylase of polypeptide subunit release factors
MVTLEELRNCGKHSNYTITTSSGIVIEYPSILDGGGLQLVNDYLKILNDLGKTYKNGYEWCCGFGLIGFELLGNKFCEHIYFSDVYEPAIENCIETSIKNGITDKVTTFLSDNVKDLPVTNLFDLVFGNPPNNFDLEDWKRTKINGTEYSSWEEMPGKDDDVRIGCDDGYKIHKEFFTNIPEKMVKGGDLLLFFVNGDKEENNIMSLAEQNGFEYITEHKTSASFGGKIIHFKLK